MFHIPFKITLGVGFFTCLILLFASEHTSTITLLSTLAVIFFISLFIAIFEEIFQ